MKKLLDLLSVKQDMNLEDIEFIDELDMYYIKSRYGGVVVKLARGFRKKQADDCFEHTRRLLKWLKSKLK